MIDVDDLRMTDFPLQVPLPTSLSLSRDQREQVRDWVLTVSVDQKVDQGLPVDQRGVYVGSLNSHSIDADPVAECVLTGYPVRGASVQFKTSHKIANREDWNKFIGAAGQSTNDSTLNDILKFINDWCGEAPNYTF